VLTDVVENGSKNDTFLRENEPASTGDISVFHPQQFGLSLPGTLLGDPFGIAVSIHDELGSICDTCLPSFTTLAIPAASNLLTGFNPFYNGIDPNQPYPWSMSAKYPSGFKLTGIIHDGHQLVTCESLGGAPTTQEPVCYTATSLKTIKSSHTVVGSGFGIENGNFGFNYLGNGRASRRRDGVELAQPLQHHRAAFRLRQLARPIDEQVSLVVDSGTHQNRRVAREGIHLVDDVVRRLE
jgi:hypothetical protein